MSTIDVRPQAPAAALVPTTAPNFRARSALAAVEALLLFASPFLVSAMLAAHNGTAILAAIQHPQLAIDALLLTGVWVMSLLVAGAYDPRPRPALGSELRTVTGASLATVGTVATLALIGDGYDIRGAIFASLALGYGLLCAERTAISIVRSRKQSAPTLIPPGKRCFDVSIAGAALITLAPLLGLIALAVRLQDGGPAVFRQVRVGQNGKPFTMLKFRSMVTNAEAQQASLAAANEAEGPLFKIKRDPRVTRVGHFLRKTSLDELPQLVNVLNGTMSLVGPRPALPSEVATYTDLERKRLTVPPGITGLWQVTGRSDLGWQEGVQLDLEYVSHRSISFDLRILGRTLGAVLRSSGAY
ncbi:sugar transferase [Leucobacter aridicollis]|uniref:Lipopolysaccharide/colanic/teichoic acid biosynthesis glycosyltransferase n=1 Tax=Leucobacter aridicollis TaxID=283878 RepID=A0A852R9Z1_9MICO|nr:sugar transferase [Leucobacter aridicollis]MBL3683489.1 sugar transferase [Leucobacter aridicollis]NYD25204.1 lipopolysaccharide/colanic/teichoic acid biosynthesis glycosyltransferase [Leucobacter aridicollis]